MSFGQVRVNPARPVWIEDGSACYRGELEAWRHFGGGWQAYVRYSVGVEMTRLRWVEADQVRLSPENR